MDDSEMLLMLERREESVLAELEEKYGRLCRSVARNILRNDEDSEECASDVLYKVWNTIPPAQPTSLMAYTAMIARRLAINRYNAQHASKRGEALPLDELNEICADGEISEAVEARELGRAINDFLAGLNSDERTMFIRRYVYAEPPETVAARLGIAKGTLNVRLFRLRGRLKSYLKERNFI